MYNSSSCTSGPKDEKSWPIIPLKHIDFNYINKPSNMSRSTAREMENEVVALRREVINLRIRLSACDDDKLYRHNNIISLTKQLEDATHTIEVLHSIVDEKTELLRETAIAIEEHEQYQRGQEHRSQMKIEKMENYIRLLEGSFNERNSKCITKDKGTQVHLELELPPMLAEPSPEQQLTAPELDLIKRDVELQDQTEPKSDQNIHENIVLTELSDANTPRNGMTNGDLEDSGVQTEDTMDFINWFYIELPKEIEQVKIVGEASETAMDVGQTIFSNFLDKINKLSDRVRVLEESVF